MEDYKYKGTIQSNGRSRELYEDNKGKLYIKSSGVFIALSINNNNINETMEAFLKALENRNKTD